MPNSALLNGKPQGFTLLEILVVVALIALTSAILVPAFLRIDSVRPSDAVPRLKLTVSSLSERSLFQGQITALQINPHSYVPLRYSMTNQRFVPIDETDLHQETLDNGLSLNWDGNLDSDLQKRIRNGMSRAVAAQANNDDDDDDDSDTNTQRADVNSSDAQDPAYTPQVYFLPGGQATSGVLTLQGKQDSNEIKLRIDPLGRLSNVKKNALLDDDKEGNKLLLPSDEKSEAQPAGLSESF